MEEEEDNRQEEEDFEEQQDQEENSRPTTPKWWRPPIPPETYLWEEIRRKRQRGGYPWTYLDRYEDTGDNLYEPVNPPPIYGSGYNVHKDHDTTSLDERMIEIPPEIEIITSEGLDGLDLPDQHDLSGVDGDREWHSFHPDAEDLSQQKPVFTAGLRNKELPKVGETSSVRPLANKTISFSPDVPDDASSSIADQEVPTAEEPTAQGEPGPSKPSALEQLKTKAGQVKQRISKISLPVRPKFNQWTNIKLARKKNKDKKGQEEPEELEAPEQGGWTEPLSLVPEAEKPKAPPPVPIPDETIPAPQLQTVQVVPQMTPVLAPEPPPVTPKEERKKTISEEKPQADSEETKRKQLAEEEKKKADEELKRLKAEEKAQRDKEQEDLKRLKEQEKLQKQKEQEEIKLQKQKEQEELKLHKQKEQEELKLQKQKEQEEQKRLKAEEKTRKDEEQKRLKAEEKLRKEKEKEDQKRLKAEEKLQKEKLDEELKRAKEEEILKARELQDQMEQELAATQHPEEIEEEEEVVEAQEPEAKSSKVVKTPEKKRKLIDIDFTKRFKRSKTPPPRPDPPRPDPPIKTKFSRKPRIDVTQNQLAAQYGLEIESREEEIEEERLREPQIFVTQPSVETESGSASEQRQWPFEERHHSQRIEYDEAEEEYDEDHEEERVPTPTKSQGKENFSRKLKGFGIKSKAIAAQTGKNLGQTMKVLGHGIKEFGVNAVQEVKAKQEAVRQRDAQKKADREFAEANRDEDEPIDEPKMKFRFRRREKAPPPEGAMPLEELPEGREVSISQPSQSPGGRYSPKQRRKQKKQEEDDDEKISRSQLLGRADRDWESPLDLAQSREASEEPFSGQASSRDSPPGSSMASSSIQQGRRQGVLEEIDSDEFFLRERGISEGEDEEEVNRFLVEELRQAFRPQMNALEGFDLPSPPSRPGRSPRKPPRKTKSPNNFQTFPPERPKRKRTPGYISAYINANPEDEEYEEEQEDIEDIQQDITSLQDEDQEDEDEGIRRVKEELRKIDQDLEDDGRYEPVNDEEPKKPARRRKQPKLPTDQPQGFYYNTIAANEWMRDLESQIENELELNLVDDTEDKESKPVPPKRVKSKSGSLVPDIDDSEINFADDDIDETVQANGEVPLAAGESVSRIEDELDVDSTLDYVDEAGYAVVHKDAPKTFPRKKKKWAGSKGNSLKRRSQEVRPGNGPSAAAGSASANGSTNGMFFSLPRYTPRTFHIVPPTRPHRTYSTLRPKRPPRNKTKSNQNLQDVPSASPALPARPTTPASPNLRRGDDDSRPSTAIGIMQGRPLPPPPRPERSPAPLNDLDQATIERMVNMRHYANFDDAAFGPEEVIEEPCTARNIPLLMQGSQGEIGSILANSEINVAVQTDPVHDEDYELNITAGSFEDEDERIVKHSSVSHLPSDDQEQREEEQVPPPIPQRPLPRPLPQTPLQPPQIVFPTRLHLDELEVDVLRVNDLTANTLSLTQLQAPHLELNSISSRGPLSVPSIISPHLTVDNLDCNRLASDAVDLPSIPPPSFYNLSSPLSRPMQNLSLEQSVESEESQENVDSLCPCPEDSTTQVENVRSSVTPVTTAPVTRSSTLPEPVSRTSSLHADPDLEDIAHLSLRLGRALLRVTVRSLHAMAEYVEMAASNDPNCQEQQRSNMQVLLCLLLVLVAGIILISRSGSIEPRWQYFLPPSDL